MPDTNKEVNLKELAEKLVNLKVLEVNKLVDIFEKEYGIKPQEVAPSVVRVDSDAQEQKKEEKTSFNVVLKSVGGAKLKVIKAIKEITGLGLKESKGLADNLPSIIKKDLKKNEAGNVKSILQEAGAEAVFE